MVPRGRGGEGENGITRVVMWLHRNRPLGPGYSKKRKGVRK